MKTGNAVRLQKREIVSRDRIVGKAEIIYWSKKERQKGYKFTDLFKSIRWDRVGNIVK